MVESNSRQDGDHDSNISKGVNVKRVNEMVDVENPSPDVKKLEDEGEQRNAEQHHVGKVAHQGDQEELNIGSMFAEFLPGPLFQLLFPRAFLVTFIGLKHHRLV